MTAYKSVWIECDWPGCSARSDRGHLSLSEARKTTAGEGWMNSRGLIDLCGPADQSPEWAQAWHRGKGHACAGHQPKLTPRGKDRLDVACSCGWADPTGWAQLRFAARTRWTAHIDEATAVQPSPETDSTLPGGVA